MFNVDARRRTCDIIVNFKHASHLVIVFLSLTFVEQVNGGWIVPNILRLNGAVSIVANGNSSMFY